MPDKLTKACKADLGSWKVDFSSAVHVLKDLYGSVKRKKLLKSLEECTVEKFVKHIYMYPEAYLAVLLKLSNIIKLYIRRGLSASPFETGWPSWWSSNRPPPGLASPGRGALTRLPLPPPPGFQPRTQQLPD